ncbi:hypothetical protein RI103_06880 [Paraburkholderia sp. FT54]|uniref:hypothetical protein n=1 Tax=Paraburkholderia sp. FT54 TaxID=3074437 RepID=UPI002877A54B|nr:hypothetical protein [Paraburkholderia sp. FT54]WNC91070.1 hypothetical protein RI103_06880 [Paraburkholderia sp. FT54]
MVELLGSAFLVEIFHRKSKDGKKVYANLKGPNGYKVFGTAAKHPITGKLTTVQVAPAVTDPKCFIWEVADREMWDSIHIPGEWEAITNERGDTVTPARSKNVLQEKIRKAKNWPQHPLYKEVG